MALAGWQDIQAEGPEGYTGQRVLVADRVRPRDLGLHQQSPGQGGAGFVQQEYEDECGRQCRSVFRAERACRSGIQLDPDDGQGTVPVAPAIRSGGSLLEQDIRDARCRTSELNRKESNNGIRKSLVIRAP